MLWDVIVTDRLAERGKTYPIEIATNKFLKAGSKFTCFIRSGAGEIKKISDLKYEYTAPQDLPDPKAIVHEVVIVVKEYVHSNDEQVITFEVSNGGDKYVGFRGATAITAIESTISKSEIADSTQILSKVQEVPLIRAYNRKKEPNSSVALETNPEYYAPKDYIPVLKPIFTYEAVGVSDATKIPDTSMTASSQYNVDTASYTGRLNAPKGWAPLTANGGDWLQVDIGKSVQVGKVETQGRGMGNNALQWVTQYIIKYSIDGTNFFEYNNGELLTANTDKNTKVSNVITPFRARYVRFYPTVWAGYPVLRVEIYEAQ